MQLGLALARTNDDSTPDWQVARFTAPKGQLLKWIGNKQRFAQSIIAHFPSRFGTYFEPLLGSGAVLASLAPTRAEGSDTFQPLIEIWQALRHDPEKLKEWYRERFELVAAMGKVETYASVLRNYNAGPNGADLLFLSRTCYGGVIRFRATDGYMSTPCGVHNPISPESFNSRVDDWSRRVGRTEFFHRPFEEAIDRAQAGDVVYCDPPYVHSQAILYGAQQFSLEAMFTAIEKAKRRGAFVALSIDGSKKSGNELCHIPIPNGLFAQEKMLLVGRSMLKRFQMGGGSLEDEVVRDRLLVTHPVQ